MKRFLHVRGVKGHLVGHPAFGATAGAPDGGPQRVRYLGMRALTDAELEKQFGRLPSLDECEFVDRFEPRDEVVDVTSVDAAKTVRKAIQSKALQELGGTKARSLMEAIRLIESKGAAKLSKHEPKQQKKTGGES